jgi:hypothetical protein
MVTAPDYFSLPAVSNSDLKELKKAYYAETPRDLAAVFAFGNLVDAMLTERVKLDLRGLGLWENGRLTVFTFEAWQLAKTLAEAIKNDPVVKLLLPTLLPQYVFVKTLSFTYEEQAYQILGRCKFDGYSKRVATGADYKTTACTTLKAFRESIEFFDYDQGAAWYMDLAKIDRFWLIGISKKNGQIFKHAVQRGDETYNRGRAKYSLWAYRWLVLLEPHKL